MLTKHNRIAADHVVYGEDDPATRFRSEDFNLAAAVSLSSP